MAATTLAKDVLYRVSVQVTDVPDSESQFERWSERELVAWLNDGQRVLAKYLPYSCSRVDVVKLATGTRQSIELVLAANIKPGDGSAPADTRGKLLLDLVRNMGADGLTPGRAIRVASREQLDAASPLWHTEAGSYVEDFAYDPRTPKYFYVAPGVSGDVWVEVSWVVDPKQIAYAANSMKFDGPSTVVISIDDQYVDDLVNYILARGHLKDGEVSGNFQLASAHINLFTTGLNAQAMAMTGANPNLKTLPFAPQVPAAAS